MPCFISDLTRTVKPPETLLVRLFFGLRLTAEQLGRLILLLHIFIINIVDKYNDTAFINNIYNKDM
jgi:hypothetical protein